MEKSLISITEQLAIIKKAKDELKTNYNDISISISGLCLILSTIIRNDYGNLLKKNHIGLFKFNDNIVKFIPLFTFENAKNHSYGIVTDDKDYFWWDIDPYDSTNRLKFLDWMEEELLK